VYHSEIFRKCSVCAHFDFVSCNRLRTRLHTLEVEHPVCLACRSNFRPRKWLKPIARSLRLNRFDQEALPSSFLIEAFWLSPFTSGTFIWCSSLWLSRIPCSGTCVTTTHSGNVNDKHCIAITPVEQSLHPVDYAWSADFDDLRVFSLAMQNKLELFMVSWLWWPPGLFVGHAK